MCPIRWVWLFFCNLCLTSVACQYLKDNLNLTYSPNELEELFEGTEETVSFNLSCNANCSDLQDFSTLHIFTEDDVIASVTGQDKFPIPPTVADEEDVLTANVTVRGNRLGLTKLIFRLQNDDIPDPSANQEFMENPHDDEAKLTSSHLVIDDNYNVIALRKRRTQDDVFRYGIIAFSVVIYLGFGCKIDLPVIWGIVKKPVGPAIGILCQFVIMPLLGFGIAKALRLDDEYGFGLLCLSTSPGGGGSNAWANLLGGDLDLSITMTFFSVILSLGMMPLWTFALGRFFIDTSRVRIPYLDIVRTLLTLVAPLLVGLLIKRFCPKKVSNAFVIIAKPMSVVLILWTLTFGVYVNLYMYQIMGTVPIVIAAAILSPWLGYLFGYLISWICRQSRIRSLTIAIETGYQNASIPIVMLQDSFPQPYGDLGAVMPNAAQLFTQVPLVVAYIVRHARKRCCSSEANEKNDSELNNRPDESLDITIAEKGAANYSFHPDDSCAKLEKPGFPETMTGATLTDGPNEARNGAPTFLSTAM